MPLPPKALSKRGFGGAFGVVMTAVLRFYRWAGGFTSSPERPFCSGFTSQAFLKSAIIC
jgi:hypothetical protein